MCRKEIGPLRNREFFERNILIKKPPSYIISMQEGGTIYAYLIFNNASFPIVPAVIPKASASIVTDSSGASRSCSIVLTPTARPAIIPRSP